MPLLYWKNRGETPLEALNRLKIEKPELQSSTLSYAGRLDPMADGYLLVLVDEANANRRMYEKYKKTYTFTLLIGFSTDSYDILGYPTDHKEYTIDEVYSELSTAVSSLKSPISLPLPPFSSFRINGKPLFYYAFHQRLDTITIPVREMIFEHLTITKSYTLTRSQLLTNITNDIHLVHGNFRQNESLVRWKKALTDTKQESFLLCECSTDASSGSYIRSLVMEIGRKIHVPCTTYNLTRTKIWI